MADVQPLLLEILPWDATIGTSVYYTFTGSKQAVENQMVVTDADTGAVAYNQAYATYEKVHHVPAVILANGKTYRAKIRVKLSDGTYSPYSNEVEFKTLATPAITITNIDEQGYVYNADVTFVATYSQANGELVSTYRFHLYDENEDLIRSFKTQKPLATSLNSLTEIVSGLEKGKGYFIECSIVTMNGMTYSHRQRFIPLYVVPSINGIISTTNDSEEGFVRISANLKQILGTQVSAKTSGDGSVQVLDTYQYEAEDWVIVPQNNPLIFRGLGMNRASDFVMKVWCKSIPDNTKFLELSPAGDAPIAIQFWKKADRVIAVKEHKGVVSRHTSNTLSIPFGSPFLLYVKAIEHRIELSLTLLP